MVSNAIIHTLCTRESRDGKTRPGPRAGPGRAGPEDPGPRALRAETGRNGFNDFLFKIPLWIVRWPLGSNKGIM